MRKDNDRTLSFAHDIMQIGAAGLKSQDVEQLKRLLLDNLGVSLAGTAQPWTVSLIAWAERFNGSGKSPVVGTNLRVAASVAALVNGTAAHGYELDDTHDESMSHPGAVVIPAALAIAAEVGAPWEDTLAAIASGYEAMARIGMASDAAKIIHKGFHPTALFGGFGSAAAAAKLLGLNAHQLAQAWGHVLSLAAGSMQFSDEPQGTDVKRLHAGYAAQAGVLAAEFIARSIGAPSQSIDGKYGFLSLYSDVPRLERLLVGRASELQIHRISLKPYSCCRLFHSLIDGLREVSNNFNLAPDKIEAINVRGPRVIFEQHMLRRPTSVMAAQYSLPFVVGATLVYGPHRYDAYRPERLQDDAILKIADKVQGRADSDIEAYYPAHMGSAVELRRTDGKIVRAKVMDSRGTCANPLTNDDILAKALGLAREARSNVDVGSARQLIWQETSGRELALLFSSGKALNPSDLV